MRQDELNARANLERLIRDLSGRAGQEDRVLRSPIQRSPSSAWDSLGGAGAIEMLSIPTGTGGTSGVHLFTIGFDGFELGEVWELG